MYIYNHRLSGSCMVKKMIIFLQQHQYLFTASLLPHLLFDFLFRLYLLLSLLLLWL